MLVRTLLLLLAILFIGCSDNNGPLDPWACSIVPLIRPAAMCFITALRASRSGAWK